MVAAVAETGAAKVSETKAMVQWRWKQRECLCDGYIGGGQWQQRGSRDGGEKSGAMAEAMAEGTGAVVLVAATVAMALAANSGNGGAGNGNRNRGSNGETTINQHAAAAVAKQRSWRQQLMWWRRRWRRQQWQKYSGRGRL